MLSYSILEISVYYEISVSFILFNRVPQKKFLASSLNWTVSSLKIEGGLSQGGGGWVCKS